MEHAAAGFKVEMLGLNFTVIWLCWGYV